MFDYPAALETGMVQDGFVFASNFDPNSVPGAAGSEPEDGGHQEHHSGRLRQHHAARRVCLDAVRA